MADASERYTSAGSQLQTRQHRSPELAAACGRPSCRGCTRLGRPAARSGSTSGPPLPPITDEADQLNEQRPVTVQGQTFQGYPNYSPNAPYYYGGGYGVPGGWYGSPFWETLLLTSVLTGGSASAGSVASAAATAAGTTPATTGLPGRREPGQLRRWRRLGQRWRWRRLGRRRRRDWGGGGGGDWGGGGGGGDGGASW